MNSHTHINNIKQYLPDDCIIEMISEVGSHMWNMDHADSDHDIVICYTVPIEYQLRGINKHSIPSKHNIIVNDERYDLQYIETEHLVNLLKKGNINAIWAILSPLCYTISDNYKDLKQIIKNINRTTSIIPSVIGMTTAQLVDTNKRANVRDPTKSLQCAYRTVQFAYNHLINNAWLFSPAPNECHEDTINSLIEQIKQHANINPTEMPKHILETWLYNTRLNEIKIALES